MKRAFERALERFDEEDFTEYSEEQKEKLGEIDKKYDAEVAKAKIDAEERRNNAQSKEEQQQIDDDLAVELASLEEQRENEKAPIRKPTDQT